MGEYRDAAKHKENIWKQRYQAAEAELESGDFEGAIEEFIMLNLKYITIYT